VAISELTDEKTSLGERDGLWMGEPITFSWEGDRFQYGMLMSPVSLPARHVHPEIRAAAEAVCAAQADLEELRGKINTRRVEHEELKQKLARGSRGKADPELAKAARELTEHTALTNLLEGDVPNAEAAVRDAVAGFAAALHENSAEWDSYLLRAGARACTAPLGCIEDVPAWLGELVLIDQLLARETILYQNPQTPAEMTARADRSERTFSVEGILSGESRASSQMGLLGLVATYAARFTPAPKPQPEPEQEPLAVRLQKIAKGLAPALATRDPFLRSG
jgi:hypothetical protein